MRIKRRSATLVLMLAGFLGSAAARADPMPIRVGWVVTPGHLAPLIEALGKRESGVFKHLGQSYVLQTTRFQGTTPQIQAQAIGELDIAALSTAALALAISNAHLDERVVADVVADGIEGFFSENFVVRADGPIKTIEDVKGKRIATNAIGSASDAAMRAMFRKHGIKDSDFTTVEANFTNMPAMLDGGKVDLIGTLPQFLQELRAHPDKYRVLFTGRDAVGPTQAVLWGMRAETVAAHRPVFVDFFEDHIRAVRWFIDPKNREEALDILAGVTKLPKDSLGFAFSKDDFYHSPDARPELQSVQREIDEAVHLGVLPQRVEISPKYVDLSLIEDAKKRIDGK
ncbi:MAG: ABC transporter substrate-binding protein [Alphaproteobacteria bacterium]|nr:ABC transporter substrate-binding protein [Alphaproteobacteria bacterium]MBV9150595.1 ABC transporter substrate-binding protein [Alphaproteobacteria bacterium]MBV9965445.1 ABC transporter substrate-binding protein [Alphaproteobacteria bacterium]